MTTPAGEGRVEDIRRRFEETPSEESAFDVTDIAVLLDRLRAVEEERDEEICNHMAWCDLSRDLTQEVQRLRVARDAAQAEARRLREAMVWIKNRLEDESPRGRQHVIAEALAKAQLALTPPPAGPKEN